ncbi:hypothetical protein [Bacillus sp. OV166]|uniref:hypothetical protein n=1 Tax=Bacillus sp. OV166 TaxID=1882763 RepID=UPI00211B5C2A|nr:hypothetical protein [Bacillus sp. OV166]
MGWTLYSPIEQDFVTEPKEYTFEWIEELNEEEFDSLFEDCDDDGEFHINGFTYKTIKSENRLNEMSEICFLYAAPDAIFENHHSALVFQDVTPWVLEIIMKEIVPHYKVVKELYIEEKFKEIQLSGLKDESKEMAKELIYQRFYPVVTDLYRNNRLDETVGCIQYFLIKKEDVTPLFFKETERIHQFMKNNNFQNNKPFVITPYGWKLDENLKDSIAIRSFYSFAKKIVLVVNTFDDSVRAIFIFGENED